MNPERTQSKSSVTSSTSDKSKKKSLDVARLQADIATLKQTIDLLKSTVNNRDAVVETVTREREKLNMELKSAQRTNRNLNQQLADERDMHLKEQEYFNEEIQRLTHKEHGEFKTTSLENDLESNMSFQKEVKAKDQVIYNIGEKYLKIKSSKKYLQETLNKLQSQSKKTCEEIVLLLQENRRTLDGMLSTLVKYSALSPRSKKYLKLIKNNATLHFENTQLKIILAHVSLLQRNVGESLNSHSEKYEPIDLVAVSRDIMSKSIEKLKVQEQSLYISSGSRCDYHNLLPQTFKRCRKFRAKLNNPMSCRNFKFQRVHEELSPFYRWHLGYSKSDSYLICKKRTCEP